MLEGPEVVIQGDGVVHLLYPMHRGGLDVTSDVSACPILGLIEGGLHCAQRKSARDALHRSIEVGEVIALSSAAAPEWRGS
jgi:hypothetical protein